MPKTGLSPEIDEMISPIPAILRKIGCFGGNRRSNYVYSRAECPFDRIRGKIFFYVAPAAARKKLRLLRQDVRMAVNRRSFFA
jgi:hypothetical protein